jgi:hypothetical protein
MTPLHFFIFVIISLLKRTRPFIWTNLNSLHPRMICTKFDWIWPAGSGEEDFQKFSVHFYSFAIISPWRRAIPFIWTKLKPLSPRMICAKSGWNWPSGSGEEVENVKVYRRTDRRTDDGQPTIRIAHLSFQLRWAKNVTTVQKLTLSRMLTARTVCRRMVDNYCLSNQQQFSHTKILFIILLPHCLS